MRRFELVEGSAAKFWQIEVVGSSFSVGWGRLGTAGQTQTKTFEDVAKAQAQADKLIREKTGKGYREVVAEAATAAAPQAVTPKAAPEKTVPSDTTKALDPAPVQTAVTPPQTSAGAEAESDSARAKAGDKASAAGVVVEPIPDPEPIDWTPEWLAICPALPGRPGPPLPNDLNAVWNALCKRRLAAGLDKFRENYLARLGLAGAGELLQRESPLPASSPAADALYFALFPYAQTSDFLVLLGGLRHAFETIVAAFEIRQVGYAVEGLVMLLHPWLALRRHIVAAPPELYHELRQEAERVSSSAPALVACRIAMLFPGEPWVRKAAVELKPSNPADLICLILDAGSIEETRSLIRGHNAFLWAGLGLPQGLLARHGVPGVTLLGELLDHNLDYEPFRAEILSCLAAVRSREALFELLDRAHLQKVRSVAREAALAQPLLGIVATADYLGKRGKNVDIARPLLRVLATSHPELLATAIAKAGKAGAAVLRDIFADAEMPTNWAPAGAWPAVLRSPAWQSAKKDSGSLANAVVPLEEPAYEETMTWLSGEREAWLAKEAGRPLSDLLRRSRVTESMIRAAVTGDSEARSALRNSSLEPLVLARLDLPEALEVFQLMPFDRWYCWSSGFEAFLAKAPLSLVIKNLIELVEFQTTYPMHHLLLPADSPRIAPRMALLHSRRRKLRDLAKSWLRRHPRAASVGLLPQALGTKADLREDAQQALRFLAAEGWREDILAVAEQYGVTANAVAILDRDPLDLLPTKIPKLPDFWDASSLAPPRLNSGESLPQQAVDTLATMLAFSRSDRPYAGIAQVREACDAGSLATFAWELFQSWLLAGAPAKENWAFLALGHLGDDSTARNLAPLIRQWPGEAAHARAVSGLEVLTTIGSDVALMLLQNIADKVKFKGLQDNARQKIEQIAEQRGLSPEELADRLAPDFGLDEDGSLELDFGARRFRVGLDEQLRPFVIDLEGKRLGELPKPNKADDALRAADALERYKTLKKDVKSFAGMQILRLEMAMVTGRRFSREVFEAFFAHHPLIRHLACRLVWAAHGEGRSAYFRVSEDGTYTDAADEAWLLPQGVEIAVPHPLDLPPEAAAGFGQIFGDYEILQPFPQLGREIYKLSAEERSQDELLRFAGHELPTGKLLGLEKLGWRRGVPQDAGCISLIERHLEKKTVYLSFRDGIIAGDINTFPTQTLEGLTICSSSGGNWLKELKFEVLSPIEASEILRDLERLVS